MLNDVEALRRANARISSGEDEDVPAEMAARLLAGESPVRVWREYRGLKIADLAARAGISKSYISEIENGNRDGTFATMSKLARGLGVTLDDLDPGMERFEEEIALPGDREESA